MATRDDIMDARCPRCDRLLGRRTKNGSLEVKQRGKTFAIIRVGAIYCSDCGVAIAIAVGTDAPPAQDILTVILP